MVPLRFAACAAVFLAVSSLHAFADTITLKSGEKLDGKILTETSTDYTVEVAVSAGIIDQRTIAKSDVKSIEKVTPDEIAYQKIKEYKPGYDSMPLASYKPVITQLNGFLSQFPTSKHAAEVKATLDEFKSDEARVKAGGLKWKGQWLTAEETARQKYQLGGEALYDEMRDQAVRHDIIGALNTFDRLEKEFPGSRVYPDAATYALALMKGLNQEVDPMVATAKYQEQQFASGVQLANEPEKSRMIAAHAAELAAYDAAVENAGKANVKWKPFYPKSDKSVDALKSTLSSEIPRVEQLPFANMRASIADADAVKQSLDAKDVATAEDKIHEAQSLWSANETLTRLNPALADLKTALAATPTPTPKPSASPSPKGSPGPKGSPSAAAKSPAPSGKG